MDEKTLTLQLEGDGDENGAPPPRFPWKEIFLISGGAILLVAIYVSVKK